jgi:hypothetical protein
MPLAALLSHELLQIQLALVDVVVIDNVVHGLVR